MNRKPATISLLLASALLFACGDALPAKPDLPQSVSPGWSRKAFDPAEPPPGVPESKSRECWKADYVNGGSAEIWICGYAVEGGAFDAMQRTRTAADTVKFQEGKYLVIARWNGVSRSDITTLIRAIQKSLRP